MKKIQWVIWLQFILLLVIIPVGALHAQAGSEDPGIERPVLVGRLSLVEGEVDRYMPDKEAWDPVGTDEPLGMDDVLESGSDGRAEVILPNITWIRIGNKTRIQLTVLEHGVTGVDVDSGIARFYNKGSDTVLRTTTPFGHVIAPAGTSFDLYVHLASVQVIAQRGKVAFVHNLDESRFEVSAGSTSIVANARRVEVREDYGDPDWEAWNMARDRLWRNRIARRSSSADYLPPSLYHEAYVLDAYGRWVKVYYDGAYRYFWRPIHVGIGWAPFTVGTWSVWHGNRNWLPGEPFGYVTHHYGNWIWVRGLWYWAPPVSRIRVRSGPPLLNIGFTWSPGRVGWIDFGVRIGWVVLAPHEHYRWTPYRDRHGIIVNQSAGRHIYVRNEKYRYLNHTVIVDKKKLYRAGDGRPLRTRNSSFTSSRKPILPMPLVQHKVTKHEREMPKRRKPENRNAAGKPLLTVNPSLDNTRLTNSTKNRHRTSSKIGRARPVDKAEFKGAKIKKKMAPLKQVRRPSPKQGFTQAKINRNSIGLSKGEKMRTTGKVPRKTMKNRLAPSIGEKITAGRSDKNPKKAMTYRGRNEIQQGDFFFSKSRYGANRKYNRTAGIGMRNR